MLGNALIAVGVGLFVCGLLVRILESRAELEAVSTPILSNPIPADRTTDSESRFSEENRKKGEDFEKWVVSKFDDRYFRVLEWRGDKQANGHFAESSRFPDLELEFALREDRKIFAIECKWRKSFYKDGIEWTYPAQLEGYQSFAKRRMVPVFVVIGVGGAPSDPDQVFVIPLDEATMMMRKSNLMNYRRNNSNRNFFFDASTSVLR